MLTDKVNLTRLRLLDIYLDRLAGIMNPHVATP
jgi:hypothetical protein